MTKIGAEMTAMETTTSREIQAAEALGYSMDKELRRLEKRNEEKRKEAEKRRNKEKLAKAKNERMANPTEEDKEEKSGRSHHQVKRRRTEGGQGGRQPAKRYMPYEGIHRGARAINWSKRKWRERCQERQERRKAQTAGATAKSYRPE